jgi:hypothetical protein
MPPVAMLGSDLEIKLGPWALTWSIHLEGASTPWPSWQSGAQALSGAGETWATLCHSRARYPTLGPHP